VRFIIYDLEATCWLGRPPGGLNEIIEIGAVMVDPTGEVLGSFSKFVKPTINPRLSGFCKKLTSISQENVNRADLYPKVIQQFQEWIDIWDENYRLCSWGQYDKVMLTDNCALHKMEVDWLGPSTDLKAEYHEIKGEHKLTGLINTLRKEGLEFTGIHHRAISDAENTAKIFVKYVDEWRW
jgi:3'-5' exoribonuclease 1|tara:strand:+ start:420 stop:962 length:543 start_codon:yes stop_codon:yes gene_type:complete